MDLLTFRQSALRELYRSGNTGKFGITAAIEPGSFLLLLIIYLWCLITLVTATLWRLTGVTCRYLVCVVDGRAVSSQGIQAIISSAICTGT